MGADSNDGQVAVSGRRLPTSVAHLDCILLNLKTLVTSTLTSKQDHSASAPSRAVIHGSYSKYVQKFVLN
jgi:hypothetical protein